MDKIIEKNEPETLKQINDSTARLAYLSERIAEIKDQLEKAEKLKDQQVEQQNELKERHDKLMHIANHYGIDVENYQQN